MLSSAFALPSPSASSRWMARLFNRKRRIAMPAEPGRTEQRQQPDDHRQEDRDRREQSRDQQAARQTSQHGALPGQTGPFVLQSGVPGRECHPKLTMISATIPTPATMAVSTSSSGEDGSGSLSRIARSLPIHLLNAPIPQANPQMTRTAAASRTSSPSRSVSRATAAIATPAARKPRPGSDPGQEGAFVGEGESWVGLRAGRVHAARPATVAVLRRRGHTRDASADRRSSPVERPRLAQHHRNQNENRAEDLPVIEALIEYDPAQQGRDHWIEQGQKGHRARGQPLQPPEPEGVRENPADQHQVDQSADVTRREMVGQSFDEQA